MDARGGNAASRKRAGRPRAGFRGKAFNLIKFRTMTDERDDQGKLLPDAKRLTPVGAFIRKTSMDELPQLVNVLSGNMSLVGPRPHAITHDETWGMSIALYARRHNVKPGITGIWQISGRSDLDRADRVRLDREYVRRQSWWLNVKLIVMTIPAALWGKGAY